MKRILKILTGRSRPALVPLKKELRSLRLSRILQFGPVSEEYSLIGSDGEGASDGSHPNDLGMMRYADRYERILRKILTR